LRRTGSIDRARRSTAFVPTTSVIRPRPSHSPCTWSPFVALRPDWLVGIGRAATLALLHGWWINGRTNMFRPVFLALCVCGFSGGDGGSDDIYIFTCICMCVCA
jgi:hypothetical protein